MSTPTDTFVESVTDGAQRTQEAVSATLTGALRTWADAVQSLTSGRASVPAAAMAATQAAGDQTQEAAHDAQNEHNQG